MNYLCRISQYYNLYFWSNLIEFSSLLHCTALIGRAGVHKISFCTENATYLIIFRRKFADVAERELIEETTEDSEQVGLGTGPNEILFESHHFIVTIYN